jgi:hypothetical protein
MRTSSPENITQSGSCASPPNPFAGLNYLSGFEENLLQSEENLLQSEENLPQSEENLPAATAV